LGAYPDVLLWARGMGSAQEFFERLARPGAANEDMRTFVETVRDQLNAAGFGPDHQQIWRLLQRFQLFV
jgi:hypothetical protein